MFRLKCFCLLFFLLARSLSASDISHFANEFSFYAFEKVMKAYEGKWSGSTTITAQTGDTLASFDSDNTYILLGTGVDAKIIGTGTINSNGKIIYISSSMYVENGKLVLSLIEKDTTRDYEGFFSYGKVYWYNLKKIFFLERLIDTFSNTPVGIQIQSDGVQPLNLPKKKIFTYVKSSSTFIKKRDTKALKETSEKEKIISDDIDFSKIKL